MGAEEIGAIWIHETKDKRTALSIRIDGEKFIGLQPNRAPNDPADEKNPDFYILRFVGEDDASKAKIVGSAWRRKTVDGRKILSIQIGKESADPLIAVMLENSGNDAERGPDMVIFRKS